MILWSIIPPETVFDRIEPPIPLESVAVNGVNVEVERLTSGERRIVRLLSTDPADYLRQDIQPGAMLSMQPQLN